MTHCPIHNRPWKTIPDGISKKTGARYTAFQVCPADGCDQKPPPKTAPQAPQTPYLSPAPNQPSSGLPGQPESDTAILAASFILAGLVYAGTGRADDAKILAHEVYQNWKGK